MSNEYITIQDASDISNKSVQTIRRAIKSGKLKYRRRQTPQGFNYSINRESLFDFYKMPVEKAEVKQAAIPVEKAPYAEKTVMEAPVTEANKVPENTDFITKDDFSSFTKTLDRLVSQHADERQNFLRLVNTLQEKIFVLENQLNLLKSPEKRWFHFWK